MQWLCQRVTTKGREIRKMVHFEKERKKETGDCFVEAINFRSLLDDEKRFVADYNLHNIKKEKSQKEEEEKSTDGKVSRGFKKKFVFV